MSDVEKAVDQLRQFLAGCSVSESVPHAKSRPCFHGTVFGKEGIDFHPLPPCHSQFCARTDTIALGSSSPIIKRNKEVAIRFHEWFFSPKESPWRELLKYGVEYVDLTSTKKMGAFILGPDLCKEIGKTVDWYAIKNMFITARCIYEKTENLKVWTELVDASIPKDVAFLACGLFKREDDSGSYLFQGLSNISGGHWGITLKDVNLAKFRAGDCNTWVKNSPPKHNGRINSIFKGEDSDKNCYSLYEIFQEKLMKEKPISGVYSSAWGTNNTPYPKQGVIDMIKSWIKEQ